MKRPVSLVLGLLLSCPGGATRPFTGVPPPPPPSGNTPALVQNVSSSTNPLGIGIDGNDFKFTLPNPVLPGNALVLKVAYLASASFAATPVTDSSGNAWPATPSASQSDVNGNIRLAIFVLPGANAGLTTLTIHFTASIRPVQYDCGEWRNIAPASPVNGSAGASGVASPTVSSGAFTPGNNDANGGNLILYYIHTDDDPGGANSATGISAAGSFTLLDADITWSGDTNSFHASSYYVQTIAAPINPSMSVTITPGTEHFVVLAVALKAASAGTAPGSGIRIVKLHHFTNETPAGSNLGVQFPTTGSNLVVWMITVSPGTSAINSIVDNHGNSWSRVSPGGPQWWIAQNATTGPDLLLTVSVGSSPGISVRMYEIAGAATSGQPDASAYSPGSDCSSVTSVQHKPDIAPGSANGLTLAAMGIGTGPGLSVSAPSGAVFDLVIYAGETDLDTMENADALGHLYNSDTSAENWSWTISSIANNLCTGSAIHLKAG